MFKLSNYKINYQILSISVIVTIGLLVILSSYLIGEKKATTLEDSRSKAQEQITLIRGIEYDFLNARRHEKDFIARRDMKYA